MEEEGKMDEGGRDEAEVGGRAEEAEGREEKT